MPRINTRVQRENHRGGQKGIRQRGGPVRPQDLVPVEGNPATREGKKEKA